MKKVLCLLLLVFSFQITYAKEEYIKGKILSLVDVVAPLEGDTETKEISIYKVQLLSGERDGEVEQIELPTYKAKEYNLDVKVGDRVVVFYESEGDTGENYTIIDVDKRFSMIELGVLFVALTLFISKKRGFRALLSLLITVVVIFKFFIPAILDGKSPILYAIITGVFSILLSIFFMTGFKKKGMIAIIGSFGGVFFAGLLSYFLANQMRLSGFETADSLSFAVHFQHIRLKELIPAGIIIGSMGAVMDVAMSISTSLHELSEQNPEISSKELFYSAINIGNDIIGTMINTLILAYIGSSLLMILMLSFQKGDYPWIRILNFEEIAVEILRSIAGSIGILISVPFTAYIGSIAYGKNKILTK